MIKHIVPWLRCVWLTLTIVVLVISICLYDGKTNSDADLILAYGMLILSFPCSIILSLIISALGYLCYKYFGYVVQSSYLNIIFSWICFMTFGYLQWFTVLPRLLNHWKVLRRRKE